MEQRDTIIKNLREISHFFLSESQPQKKTQPPIPNQKKQPKNESTVKSTSKVDKPSTATTLNNTATPIIPLHKHTFPHIIYVLGYNKSIKIVFYTYNIACELAKKNISSCIVTHRETIAQFHKLLTPLNLDITIEESTDNLEVLHVQPEDSSACITLIGRQSSSWGAPLTPYMTNIDTAFITDLPAPSLHKLMQSDTSLNTLFFTQPSAKNSFKTYHIIRTLLNTNSKMWCGIVVTDSQQISQGKKAYNAIANTLLHFSCPNPVFLGTLFNHSDTQFCDSQSCKHLIGLNKNSFSDIGNRFVTHLFPTEIAKR